MSATIVLVHGSWHGAWAWERVLERLRERGIDAVAVDLPAHGDLHAAAASVRRRIDETDGPVVLLGHSYGGMVISEAGEHPAVRHLVYLCAFMPDDGESLADLVGSVDDPGLKPDVHLLPGEREGEVLVHPDHVRELFYADCSDEDVEWAKSRLRPEWAPAFGQQPAAIAWRNRPSTYVLCTQDNAIRAPLQETMARHATEKVEWETSHSPFLSRPELVAELLEELAARY